MYKADSFQAPRAGASLTTKPFDHASSHLENALTAAKKRFVERNPVSGQIFLESEKSLPGGNTRTLLYVAPYPICMKNGNAHRLFDEDGHEYTDFVGELTAALFGHSHPIIQKKIIETVTTVGLNLGATIAQEGVYAKLFCSRFRLDKVRFCNSGTEANLHALAGAKYFTGKRKVVVFSGGYHGAVFAFWDGVEHNGVDKHEWVIGKYNDVEGAKKLIEQDDIAAVLVEGMQGAGGCLPATDEFLFQIQESTKKVKAIFIMDEVMTSRLGPSGLQNIIGLSPDMTTFGKYLGGGMAFGAFGGREDIMHIYDPRNPQALAHSGTFNNNTLAMNAGFAGLSEIYTPEVAVQHNEIGDAFRVKLQELVASTKMSFTGRGSLVASHFSDIGTTKILCKEDVQENWDIKDLFYLEMMEEGFWLTRRGSMAIILETPQSELDRFISCVEGFLTRHKEIVTISV